MAAFDVNPGLKYGNETYLLYGRNGWIGGMLIELLTKAGNTVHLGDARLENRADILADFEKYKPTRVLNAAGVTGRPNVDWCETNKQTVLRTNVVGTLNLSDICWQKKIHCTLYATGCIFEYDEKHPLGGGLSTAFTEEEDYNFDGSYYSWTKGMMEQMLKSAYLDYLCVLRVRMPISDDLSPRNFVTKISKYQKVVNIPNSMTVLADLLPTSLKLSERAIPGVFNFCNPGPISHNEILELYKEHIDPTFTWENFTVEEQDKILEARRSNNELNCTKICDALPDLKILPIKEAMVGCMKRMRANLEAAGTMPPPKNPK